VSFFEVFLLVLLEKNFSCRKKKENFRRKKILVRRERERQKKRKRGEDLPPF